jgi:uncharacterized protein (TIGR03083 family)
MENLKPVEPIHVVELFPPLSRELLKVLRALQPADWDHPTICSPWTVKDVAAHLLGGNLGRLWMEKASTLSEAPLTDYEELVSFINRENEVWVQAARRISPEILIEFLDLTDRRLYEHFRKLDPHALAVISVAWASEDLAPHWFDIAREYTEKWLHQQHILEAVDLPLLTGKAWMSPVLDTFVRGLPRTFRDLDASEGSRISVQIPGEAGGSWTLVKDSLQWQLYEGLDPNANSIVQIDQDLAWRLFTKGVSTEASRPAIQIEGDARLGEQVLKMVSIMA